VARVEGTPPAAARTVLLAAVAVLACVGTATRAEGSADRSSPTQQLVDRMNAARVARGKPKVVVSAQLSRAAAMHTRAMARRGFFTHSDADGTPFWKRIGRYYRLSGYRSWRVGENIYWSPGAAIPAQIVSSWLRSPPHRRDLLGTWKETGVAVLAARDAPGVFGGKDVTIVVADFGSRSG
jgi:uncharacterized protein YkwD